MANGTEELTPYQQAVYDSTYKALIAAEAEEDDAVEQALEAARQTDPVPPSGMGQSLGMHRGGPATFYGHRAMMRPGEIVDFPPVPAGPSPAANMARPALEPPPEPVPSAAAIAPRSEPVNVPILPPGPSEEFLKRARATGLGFGVLTGDGKSTVGFSAPRPPGADVVDQMESLRQQINALKFKDSKDALNAATQFQATHAYQNFLAQGGTEAEGLKRYGRLMFYSQPSALPGMIRETTPIQPPKLSDVGGGVNVVTGGRGGSQFRIVPRAALPQKPFELEKVERDGAIWWHVSPNSYVRDKDVPTAPAGVRASIYKAQIAEAEQAKKAIANEKYNPLLKAQLPELDKTRAKRLKEAQDARAEAIRRRDALLESKPSAPAAAAAGRGRPVSKAEYDALPSGARYLDPNGVERVKG